MTWKRAMIEAAIGVLQIVVGITAVCVAGAIMIILIKYYAWYIFVPVFILMFWFAIACVMKFSS